MPLPPLLTALGPTSGLLADRYLDRMPGLLDVPVARGVQLPAVGAGTPADSLRRPGTPSGAEPGSYS